MRICYIFFSLPNILFLFFDNGAIRALLRPACPFSSVHSCYLFSLMVSRSPVCSFPSYLPPISIRSHEVRLFAWNVCAQSSHHSANTYMSVFQMPCVRIYVPRGNFIPTRVSRKTISGAVRTARALARSMILVALSHDAVHLPYISLPFFCRSFKYRVSSTSTPAGLNVMGAPCACRKALCVYALIRGIWRRRAGDIHHIVRPSLILIHSV